MTMFMPQPDYTKSHSWGFIKIIMIWGSHSGAAASGMWCCVAGQAVSNVSDCSTFCSRLKQPKKTVCSKYYEWLAQWHSPDELHLQNQVTSEFQNSRLSAQYSFEDHHFQLLLCFMTLLILNKNQLNSVKTTGSVQCLIHLTHTFEYCTNHF